MHGPRVSHDTKYVYGCPCTQTRMRVHVCIHVYIYIHIHIMSVYIHIHVYIYNRRPGSAFPGSAAGPEGGKGGQ